MPICTTCTHPVPYLYTVYQSANNLRLEQCPECQNFADPYVEHDNLILLLDLILLKRGVFRHLLFNRGYEPRHAAGVGSPDVPDDASAKEQHARKIQNLREKARYRVILQLGFVIIFIDACGRIFVRTLPQSIAQLSVALHGIQTSHAEPADGHLPQNPVPWTIERIETFLRILAGCMIETIAFHIGITLTSALALYLLHMWEKLRRTKPSTMSISGVRTEFRLSHIPLTLFYSSLTKLFLLLLLSLWKPSSTPRRAFPPSTFNNGSLFEGILEHEFVQKALKTLDDDKLDREWVVRNVLGGMAAGFGLRVVLDIRPFFTTCIVLTGWAVKTFVANILHPWVSKNDTIGDVFLAYSIP